MARIHVRHLIFAYLSSPCVGSEHFVKARHTSKASTFWHLSGQVQCTSSLGYQSLQRLCTIQPAPLLPAQLDNSQGVWNVSSSKYHTKKGPWDKPEISIPKDSVEREKASHKKALEGGTQYCVVQIKDDGSWHHLTLKSSELGIHPRDVDVLARSKSFVPQRATLSVRKEKIIVRMENVRALVCKDHVLLFEARRPPVGKVSGTPGNFLIRRKSTNEVMDRARELFAISMAEQVKEPPADPHDVMPFHLKMVECLLEETSSFFNQKVERLKVLVERMLEELNSDVNMGGLQRLLPLKRALTEVEHDIQDAHMAMDQVLNSDEALQSLCFEDDTAQPSTLDFYEESKEGAWQQTNLRQAAADMLLTYQREFDDAGGALEELRKDLNAAQEIWELGLDTTRNRIIRTDLMMSMGTLSVSLAAAVGTFFGMNLPSGYEEHPTLFWWVTGTATATSLIVSTALILYFRIWPKIADKRRAQDLAGLHDLLQHLDDIDDIFQLVVNEVAGKTVTHSDFRKIVRRHPSAHCMQQSEIDLMFRLFDVNRNHVLELRELNLQQSRSQPTHTHQ